MGVRQCAVGVPGPPVTGRLPDPAFWRGKRVLLTGHTGFKGAWLALWLQRLGADVTGLALPPEPGCLAEDLGLDARMPSHFGDIRDADTVDTAMRTSAPDVVFHLAAQALVRRSYQAPVETFASNVMGTVHVLDAMRHAPDLRAAIIVTTDKCYENREWIWPYREDDRLGGHDPYSASKACAELAVAAWQQTFPGKAAVASVRAGNVIGGGDWSADRLVPDCIRAFANHEPVRIRNPDATRPWQHVLEPLCGYLLLAERLWQEGAPYARAWNFGPAAEDVEPVSAIVAGLAGFWGQGAAWQADPGPHPHEAGQLAVDSSRARKHLQWLPRLRLQDAVGWTGAWYRNHRAGEPAAQLVHSDIARYQELEPS